MTIVSETTPLRYLIEIEKAYTLKSLFGRVNKKHSMQIADCHPLSVEQCLLALGEQSKERQPSH